MQLDPQPTKKAERKSKTTKQPQDISNNGVSYLNVISLSDSKTNAIALLTATTAKHSCNIINTRITELGKDLACTALVSGKWNDIIKLEKALSAMITKHSLNIQISKNNFVKPNASNSPTAHNYITYVARAITLNRADLLDKLLQFLAKQNISIKEVAISTINTRTNLISLEIQIIIPGDQHISALREDFFTYCDNLNLDISLEPLT